MRIQPAGKNVAAIDEQVVRGDGGTQSFFSRPDIVNTGFAGDMFQNDFQVRKVFAQRVQFAVDKHSFTIENVHAGIADFAMDQ